jgi:uncharacterized protein (TIGR03084 family)
MLPVAKDLGDEADELHAFLETLDEKDWRTPTLFMSWTPWDIVAHLHFFDQVSILALTDLEAFGIRRRAVIEDLQAGKGTTEQQRTALMQYDAPTLLERWKTTCDEMAHRLGESDPKRRLPWFGPDMGVAMFTTARYMETWAHAQAIYDLKHVERVHTDRIKNICTIGIKTFAWTFVNRGLEPPGPPPFIRLTAPSGAIWEWNEPSEEERIEGRALDFCWTVTQVRNVADTDLQMRGEVANRWMEIAQCFAGGPVDPPAPGYRTGG